MTTLTTAPATDVVPAPSGRVPDVDRLSTRFGLAFPACQLLVMVAMTVLVLPRSGSIGDTALARGTHMLDAQGAFRVGNYVFMLAGTLLLGFLGAVHHRLRSADGSGVLAAVAVAAGTLIAFVWPFAAVLHDVSLETAAAGTDLRMLAGWDAIAPFSLAFSVLPRLFFVGAILVALRADGRATWLRRTGLVLLPVSLAGSATLLVGDLFPVLALSTLGFDVWVAALAWHWLRHPVAR